MDNPKDKTRNLTSSHRAETLSYDDKLRMANHDALRAVMALGVVFVVWLVCGFGLSRLDVQVFHIPLWVVGGLLGTWIAAIVVSVVLARSFRDFDLEECADSISNPDVNIDLNPNINTNTNSNSNSDSDVNSDVNADSDSNSNPYTNSRPGPKPSPGAKSRPNSCPNPGPGLSKRLDSKCSGDNQGRAR